MQVTLSALAARFAAAPGKFDAAVKRELSRVGAKVQATAKKKFGHYQPAVGEFPAWANLKKATIRVKERAGGGEDPLIGHYPKGHKNKVWPSHLRNSIESYVERLVVHIGTADPLGKHHEYGAPAKSIPPRPFLRPAAFECEKYFVERMGLAWQEAVRAL